MDYPYHVFAAWDSGKRAPHTRAAGRKWPQGNPALPQYMELHEMKLNATSQSGDLGKEMVATWSPGLQSATNPSRYMTLLHNHRLSLLSVPFWDPVWI